MQARPEIESEFLRSLGPGLHLSPLFDYLPGVYLYVKDRQSRFVGANRALARLHGCPSGAELKGKCDHDFHPRLLADQYVAEDRRVMEQRQPIPNQVWLVTDQDGQLRWFLSTKIPLFDEQGRPAGIAGVMRDFENASEPNQPFREMEEVLQHVVTHYREKLTVGDLARLAHLSISQFDRKFKRLFAMTPQQYIMRVRINAACRALSTADTSIAQIAQDTGFFDQSYFTKQFKKQTGMTPVRYRQEYAATAALGRP